MSDGAAASTDSRRSRSRSLSPDTLQRLDKQRGSNGGDDEPRVRTNAGRIGYQPSDASAASAAAAGSAAAAAEAADASLG